MKTLLLCIFLLLTATIQAQQVDTVAISVPRADAIRWLNGECVDMLNLVLPEITGKVVDTRPGYITIILKRETSNDAQAVAHALAIALHAHQEHTHSEKGVIPEGFIDVGDTFNDELNREMELIVPKIKPVTFCK